MGNFQVLIGEIGSAGQAGPAGSAAAAKSAKCKGPRKVKALPPVEGPSPGTENHFIECAFTDSAGNPLGSIPYKITGPDNKEIIGTSSPEGRVRHDGYAKKGSFTLEAKAIANCKWGAKKVKPGESIGVKADIDGFDDKAEAVVQFFSIGQNTQELVGQVTVPVKGKKIDLSWTVPAAEEFPVSQCRFYVVVENIVGVSDVLTVVDFAEIELLDDYGEPIADAEYAISLSDGTIRRGKLNGQGKSKEQDIPPGDYEVEFKDYPEPAKLDG
jgi:hypothetical protein